MAFISNRFALKNQQENKHELKGIHGSGEHHLDLSVSSGKIDILDLSVSSGKIEVK